MKTLLHYKKGDITDETYGILLNGVNCQNVMGSGVAKAYYTKWPQVKSQYHEADAPYLLGQVDLVEINKFKLYVLNCWTQEFYGRDKRKYADPRAILDCLDQSISYARLFKINEIYSPKIGCGLGGLDWETEVLPIFVEAAKNHPDIKITNLSL